MTLDEAATIPIAYLTAFVSLFELAHLGRDVNVLIHAATGGVGMAAVRLAQAAGARIFATAGLAKHDALRQMGVACVFDSRSPGFAEQVLRETSGRGVDILLNTLGPEFTAENVCAGNRWSLCRPDEVTS